MPKNISYCGTLVRAQDPDRFLISMLFPPAAREGLWALFAFNYEIAKTREVVSETQLGLIRLQWWREAIEKIYAGESPLENEILPALAKCIHMYGLPQEHFETLLYAREFDLEDVLPGNLEGLINYTDFTSTPLCKMVLKVVGDDPDSDPVQPIASAYALIGVLRAVIFHARQKRCYLPEDLLKVNNVRTTILYDLKPQDGLSEVVEAVCGAIITDVKPHSKFLKALQSLTKIYVKQLKRCGYDVFNPKMLMEPAFKEIRLIFSVM